MFNKIIINLCILFLALVNNFSLFSMRIPNRGVKPPIGLENIGNTCFINAVLQSFYNIDEMTDFLLSKRNTDYYKQNSLAQSYINVLYDYKNNLYKNSKIFKPIAWCEKLWNTKNSQRNNIFRKCCTGDAEELMTVLLDHLFNIDIKNPNSVGYYGFPIQNNIKTYLSELFQTTYSKNQYGQMGQIETHNTLSLSIQDEYRPEFIYKSIYECLNADLIKKNLNIIKLPSILIIQYIRWHGINNKKIYTGVSFPVNNLNLEKYLNLDVIKNQQYIYDLNAIIMHHGETSHYSAYINKNDNWYYCNDSIIRVANKNEIENISKAVVKQDPSPYILIYKQKPQRPSISYPETMTSVKLKKDLENNGIGTDIINNYLAIKDIEIKDLVNGFNDQLLNMNYLLNDIFDTMPELVQY